MTKISNTSHGITFGGLLQIAFIVLKLCKVIDWSWWWVLAPSWIGVAVILLAAAYIFLRVIIDDALDRRKNKDDLSK